MNLKPGDTIFIVLPRVTDHRGFRKIVETVVWRHADYLIAGRYWPTVRIVLTPDNEGVEWSRPDGPLVAALKTVAALMP